MTREFTVVIERDPESGWLVGSVAELPGCYTQAPTLAALEEGMREAIAVYLETLDEDEAQGPLMSTTASSSRSESPSFWRLGGAVS